MLFDRRFADRRAKLFDVSGDGNSFDFLHFESTVLAPVEELLYRARVSHPGVAITDARREKFDKAAACALAVRANNRRQRL
jgi:hypothetical protein